MSRLGTLAHNLYSGEVSIDFVGKRRRWYALSAVFLLLALVGLLGRGLNLGIEFKGGSEFTVPTTASVEQGRAVVEDAGITDSIITQVGGDRLRIQTQALTPEESAEVTAALSEGLDVPVEDIGVTLVGPSWGAEITQRALQGLIVFMVLVVVFLSFYFEWRLAIAAIIALIHDVLITIGIYALTGFEVTPATVIGVLTILGFSLYDTVVVFDKVKENTRGLTSGSRMTYSEAANLALNQTLVRSINTSVVALLPIVAILIVGVGLLGAGTLKDLALALFIGTAAGTYSSIFIATPVACQLQERRPEYQALAKRVAARRSGADITGKPVSKRARNRAGTAVLEAEADSEPDTGLDDGDLPADAGEPRVVPGSGAVVQTGPRQQPKRNQTRSQRKKR
jgi:preprotein translocase subunit SecF